MNITGGTKTGATIGLGKQERKLSSGRVGVDDLAFVECPVVLGGVTTVVGRVHNDTREIRESVLQNTG